MAQAIVDFYFSFRSPYSYLAAARTFALADRYDLGVNYRGVRPMVTRGVPLPVAKRLYLLRDARREARRLGLAFGPVFDPIGDGALRCLAVAELAKDRGVERRFVPLAAEAIWARAVDVAEDAELRPLCEQAGLDWNDCLAALGEPAYAERIEDNVSELRAAGHWGVPTFIFGREVFWGQDRLGDLERALEDAGVARRQ